MPNAYEEKDETLACEYESVMLSLTQKATSEYLQYRGRNTSPRGTTLVLTLQANQTIQRIKHTDLILALPDIKGICFFMCPASLLSFPFFALSSSQ